jgi:hypothetical protein
MFWPYKSTSLIDSVEEKWSPPLVHRNTCGIHTGTFWRWKLLTQDTLCGIQYYDVEYYGSGVWTDA